MTAIEVFAPAKINLTLHVTGQRADGYHLLDSLVMFADVGDRLRVAKANALSLTVDGPIAAGVPADHRNLCWKAAEVFGAAAAIELHKHLPNAAGIGGGSSDAAAVLKAMTHLFGRGPTGDPLALGADVPVCMHSRAARMRGIGEDVQPVDVPELPAVLVNPGVDVPTPDVFRALDRKDNPAMAAIPTQGGADAFLPWLAAQRNDLEPAAIKIEPLIRTALDALRATPGARLVRMSGSGATCFAIYDGLPSAVEAATWLSQHQQDWWIAPCTLR